MQAIKQLSSGYHLTKSLDLSTPRIVLWLNLAAIPLLLFFGWVFSILFFLVTSVRPFPDGFWDLIDTFSGGRLLGLILSIVGMLVMHELIHGAFFWLFTHERPKFALRAGYAFAAAPDWYLPKAQYVFVGLSPFALISLISLGMAAVSPPGWIVFLLMVASFNAAGALGDLIVVAWVLRQPAKVYINDQGDTFHVYGLEGIDPGI